jgi:chemotaxis protein methyltransferase CheR
MWQIAPDIRAMVRYQQLNLLADFSHLGVFDLIFCRNVLIYFDQETKIDFCRNARDGYLVLGAAETVVGLPTAFDRSAAYMRRTAARAATAGASRGPRPSRCNRAARCGADVVLALALASFLRSLQMKTSMIFSSGSSMPP